MWWGEWREGLLKASVRSYCQLKDTILPPVNRHELKLCSFFWVVYLFLGLRTCHDKRVFLLTFLLLGSTIMPHFMLIISKTSHRPRVTQWLERPLEVREAGVRSPTASHQRR